MKLLWCLMVAAAPVAAQTDPADAWVPSLTNLMGRPASELRDVVARYSSDRRALGRRYDLEASAVRWSAMARFDRAWLKQITGIGFDPLGLDGRIDHLLLRNLLTRDLAELRRDSLRAAAAEVRRSFNGTYSPLHQIASMMGGLQFRALRRELVDSGKVTTKAFHDAILQSGTCRSSWSEPG